MPVLFVENVRSFTGKHSLPISRLTVLSGENSSGKSTLLALLAAVHDPAGFPFRPGFNRSPYSLGAYDTIAAYRGGKYGRAKRFAVGYQTDAGARSSAQKLVATYVERDGQAALDTFAVESDEGTIALSITEQRGTALKGSLRLEFPDLVQSIDFDLPTLPAHGQSPGLADLVVSLLIRNRASQRMDYRLIERITGMAGQIAPGPSRSLAPIRTRPERVYAQLSDSFDPGGDHIPFVLDRLLRDPDAKDTQAVLSAIQRFGEESGLFSGLKVRKLGHKIGDPFQVMVNVGGRMRNLIDVGYGVSQALPIVVELALASPRDLLLVQQPEVHLHPKAQAALGSLLALFVQRSRRRVVVETHSDYLIDRVRSSVGAGKLPSEAVSFVFLERDDLDTRIHRLALDSEGNIENPPSAYRSFFLEEQRRVLEGAK